MGKYRRQQSHAAMNCQEDDIKNIVVNTALFTEFLL